MSKNINLSVSFKDCESRNYSRNLLNNLKNKINENQDVVLLNALNLYKKELSK